MPAISGFSVLWKGCFSKFLFTITLFIIRLHLSAQPYFDVLNIQFINSPDRNLANKTSSPSAIQYLSVQTGLPVKMNQNFIVFNPFYESYRLKLTGEQNNSLTFYSVGLPVTYLKQWKTEKWKTAFVLIPRINSDFEKISSNNYQYGGAAVAIYEKKENLKYKFGVYYNSEFFGPFIIPLLGIDWNINARTNLFGLLPGNLTLEYKISSTLYGGINFKSITNTYRFTTINENNYYLKIADNYLKIFLDYYPMKNIAVTVEAGHTAFRKYSTGIGDELTHLKQLKDGTLLKAGISYRIRLTEIK